RPRLARPSHRRGTGLASSSGCVRAVVALLALMAAVRPAGAVPATVVVAGQSTQFGLPLSRISDPALDDHGRIAFVGTSLVVFRRSAGGVVHLLGAGDNTPFGRVAGVGPPALGSAGCFAAHVDFVGGQSGVFRQCGGSLSPIARAGDPLAGGDTLAAFDDAV